MKPSVTSVAALAIALASFTAASTLQGQAASREEVMAVVRRLFDGMRAGDSAMARSAFDATARLISVSDSAGIPRLSATSIDRFLAAIGTPHTEMFDERIWDTEVRVDAGLASVWTKYAFYRGERFSHCGVDVFELAKRPDGWKIIHIADTRRTEGCWTGPQ